MFTRILVPLDGSPRAEQAVAIAARLARAAAGTVILFEAVRSSAEFEVGAVAPAVWAPAAEHADRERALNYLKRVAAGEQLAGVATEVCAYAGPAAATLLLAAEERAADLIVMTTRGLTGLKRWMLGSVAEKVAHASPIPVLLLHEQTAKGQPSDSVPTRPSALVALDGSEFAEVALLPAAQLINALAAPEAGELHIVRVLDLVDDETITESANIQQTTDATAREWALRQARTYLEAIAARTRAALGMEAPTITWSVVVNTQTGSYETDVAGAILRTAEEGEPVAGATAATRCRMIAMASHGRGGLAHWILGSIVLRVLHTTTLPMLIVRPPHTVPRRSADDAGKVAVKS